MPKDTSIKKILVVGAGPIVIGQGCEFDYSGTQACKALREEGYKVVLVNSNPARTPITIANPFGESDRCGQMVSRSSGCDLVWFSLIR